MPRFRAVGAARRADARGPRPFATSVRRGLEGLLRRLLGEREIARPTDDVREDPSPKSDR
jgi:hypothetical protein